MSSVTLFLVKAESHRPKHECIHECASARAGGPLDHDWIVVSGIVRRKCLPCHVVGDHPIDFANYEGLLSAKTSEGVPLVVPGKPEASALVRKTHWDSQGADDPATPWETEPEMPPKEEDWLTPGQMHRIWQWIARGAKQIDPQGASGLTEMDFPSAQECKGCHPRQFEEWSRSPHAYAQKSPVFTAFNQRMQERTSGTVGTFCVRCHTPQGIALGENGRMTNDERSVLALEGITCVVCHRRSHKHGRVSVQFSLQPGELMTTCMYGPFDDPLLSEKERHPSTGDPFIRTSMFCGGCHDVTNPEGLRLEEAFSEFRNSPAARKGINCQDCHMGPVPGVPTKPDDRPLGYAAEVPNVDISQLKTRPLTTHHFCGPDYSLLRDTEYPHKLDWMYECNYSDREKLTPYQRRTLEKLREGNRALLAKASQDRYTLLRNAARVKARAPQKLPPGGIGKIHVEVTNIFLGHNLPTGFTEERQVWVEVDVRDQENNLVFASGDFDNNDDLRYVHSFDVSAGLLPRDQHLMHFQSLFLISTERGTERAVIIPVQRDRQQVNIIRPATGLAAAFGRPGVMRIQKTNLPPLATRKNTYPFRAPSTPQRLNYTVGLRYRHLPPHLLDKIGVPDLKKQLEVVTIDQVRGVIEVLPGASAWFLERESAWRSANEEPIP